MAESALDYSEIGDGDRIHGTTQFGDELDGDEQVCPFCWLQGRVTPLSDSDGSVHVTCMGHRDKFLVWARSTADLRVSRRTLWRVVRLVARLKREGSPPDTVVWRDVSRKPRSVHAVGKERQKCGPRLKGS